MRTAVAVHMPHDRIVTELVLGWRVTDDIADAVVGSAASHDGAFGDSGMARPDTGAAAVDGAVDPAGPAA